MGSRVWAGVGERRPPFQRGHKPVGGLGDRGVQRVQVCAVQDGFQTDAAEQLGGQSVVEQVVDALELAWQAGQESLRLR